MSKTKSQILSSAYENKDTVPFPEHDWEPEVRSLTDAEFTHAQAMIFDGQDLVASQAELEEGKRPDQINLKLGGLIESEFNARVWIVSCGLIEKWSVSEVTRIPFPGAVKKLSDKILELGGHNLYEGLEKGVRRNVSKFRSERDGSGDSDPSSDGDSSGDESDGDDNHSEGVPLESASGSVQQASGE